MITTYFNPADILYGCREVYEEGAEPIIYVSKHNAKKIMESAFSKYLDTKIDLKDIKDKGYIGKYKGYLVYVTNTVGDLWVIVPKYKENIKDE